MGILPADNFHHQNFTSVLHHPFPGHGCQFTGPHSTIQRQLKNNPFTRINEFQFIARLLHILNQLLRGHLISRHISLRELHLTQLTRPFIQALQTIIPVKSHRPLSKYRFSMHPPAMNRSQQTTLLLAGIIIHLPGMPIPHHFRGHIKNRIIQTQSPAMLQNLQKSITILLASRFL